MDWEERRKRAGTAIREQRKRLDLTQVQVANQLSAMEGHGPVTQAAVSLWESGSSAPDPWRLPYLESVVGLAPGTLARLYGFNVDEAGGYTIDDVLALLPDLDERGRAAVRMVYEAVRAPSTASP